MLSLAFELHGSFCASHPLEVIIASVTTILCLLSMSLFTGSEKICGWNYICPREDDHDTPDTILTLLSITRCLAVLYIYIQFRNLRKLGSKYILGIAAVFTIGSSFMFSLAIVKMFGNDFAGFGEVLPFFVLLIDLPKASTLARFALSSSSQEEVRDNIARGMRLLGPSVTLDTVVEALVIGVGTLSGVRKLETMCCFGCLTVVASYLAFMTFYPACLALVLELAREKCQAGTVAHLQQLARIYQKEEEMKKPNPVVQRVKVIMSAGLMLVHIHSRWISAGEDGHLTSGLEDVFGDLELTSRRVQPDVSLWQHHLQQLLMANGYNLITLVLALVLTFKYLFFDDEIDPEIQRLLDQAHSLPSSAKNKSEETNVPVPLTDQHAVGATVQQKPVFVIGEYDESSDEETTSKETQTDFDNYSPIHKLSVPQPPKPLQQCIELMNSDDGPSVLSDEDLVSLVKSKKLPGYKLEKYLGDYERGVLIRRKMVSSQLMNTEALDKLPYVNYDYQYVDGACCENVVGYMPVPVGVAGPLLLDGLRYHIPMATTEGTLVASTNRGCSALMQSGGVSSSVIADGMTRAPVVRLPSAKRASEVKLWMEHPDNFEKIRGHFDATSRFAQLQKLQISQAGRLLYIRFVATTGDAMGMNMLSKGSEKALKSIEELFPDLEILSLSGNFCTDKKPSAVNWLEGRGKSVVCEATIPAHVVHNVLKTTSAALVELNIAKNLTGSAMAASIGGFNAHAANIVTAVFIATGQDPAQAVTSANCMTQMETSGAEKTDLYISCTMPCIEVGTVGGGTILPPQNSCLQMLGVSGASNRVPGDNARKLGQIVCGAVLAGELSLMSALAAGHLVRSHMTHNRSSISMGFAPATVAKEAEMSSSPAQGKSSEDTTELRLRQLSSCANQVS